MSDREHSSTRETTPIATPQGFGTVRRSDRDKDSLFPSWQNKTTNFSTNASSYVDDALLESEYEDSVPLFNEPSRSGAMGSRTTPINIHSSPHYAGHSSRLAPDTDMQSSSAMSVAGQPRAMSTVYGNGESHSGAQPISMDSSSRDRPRRESLAGSMVTGMSWGGTSVGSWIRDEYGGAIYEDECVLMENSIIMQGTSPFGAYQSPSYHSSSYLPKLEANFMKDFTCCGKILPSMHDLLAHYEENHSTTMGTTMSKQNSNSARGTPPDPKAAIAAGAANAIKDPSKTNSQVANAAQKNKGTATPQRSSTPVQQRTPQPAQTTVRGFAPPAPTQASVSQEDDAVGDMEIDDAPTTSGDLSQYQYHAPDPASMMQSYQLGVQPSRMAPLDVTSANMGPQFQQYRGLRTSTPTTPVSANRPGSFYQNNPTVSSVNTPTLTTNPTTSHLQQYYTPDSSAPGTPGELDGDLMGNMSAMHMSTNGQYQPNPQFNGFTFANSDMLDLCIDEPAKRLLAANGAFSPTSQPQPQQQQQQRPTAASASQLGDGQYTENSEIARTIREQQKLAGVPDPSADGIPKPFHCPVIGCEKAYKNQNGLKYHKNVSRSSLHRCLIILGY